MLALVNASLSLLVITNLTVVARITWGVVFRMIKRSYDAGKGEANTQMPEGLSHAEKHLWQVFQLADVDGSNSLDTEEFEKALRKGHYDFSQVELKEMLEEVDQDRSGRLEFKEFGKIATRLSMMRIPEAALLGRLLLFEQLIWGLVHTFGLVCSKPLPCWPSRCGNPNPTPNLTLTRCICTHMSGHPRYGSGRTTTSSLTSSSFTCATASCTPPSAANSTSSRALSSSSAVCPSPSSRSDLA